ncbi:MAG TPA: AAA family ATPase, partial [Thermoflexales bacterium]|nr:AAA family ATPase [Thermoflexales bacterium]
VAAHAGRIVKTTGDGCHAAFTSAADGIAAALDAQRALGAEDWESIHPEAIRVRMGVYTGEAEARGGDYYGPAVNRAARLMSVGHGGQVLVSAVTAELARDRLAAGLSLRDLGEHRLKDLVRPERIFQLAGADLKTDFPPLKSLDVLPNNLPAQLTSFVGRAAEIAEAKSLLGATRLLTLTGSGGTGKTRLSLQVAAESLADFADGVWLVELAPLADPDRVAAAVAAIFDVRDQPGRTMLEQLQDYLRTRQVLLVLDNCEHLIAASARVADALVRACPRVKVLASSREALGLAGERIFHVPSLGLPDARAALDVIGQSEAVQLFVERAAAAQPRFSLNEQNAGAVGDICRRLDGIPLAIELAAARIRLFAAEQIAARLNDRFKLLTGGSRTALPRQQTLRALIDWSYDLLPESEKALLRRVSVFAGGWTFEAAEAVCDSDDLLDALGRLVDKSLVAMDDCAGEARYGLLETVRQYAREKLFDPGETEDARAGHLAYFVRLAGEIGPRLITREAVAGLDQLEAEQDNLRAALERAVDRDSAAAMEMVAAIHAFWVQRASSLEGLDWANAALKAAAAAPTPDGRAPRERQVAKAQVLASKSALMLSLGDSAGSRDAAIASADLAREIGDVVTLAFALSVGATAYGFLSDFSMARAWLEESLALSRKIGFVPGIGMGLAGLVFIVSIYDPEAALPLLDEAIAFARTVGNPWAMGLALTNVARLARTAGRGRDARAMLEEAAAIARGSRNLHLYVMSRSELGHILRLDGALDEAATVYRETLPAWLEQGRRAAAVHGLECLGFVAAAQGRVARAACLLGAAEAQREALNAPMTFYERVEYDAVAGPLCAAPEAAAAWAEGRRMTMDEAVALATDDR